MKNNRKFEKLFFAVWAMKRSVNYIISLILLVTFPVTGLGLTVFHHHCNLSNEDHYSINSSKLCNCHHEDDHADAPDACCGLPSDCHSKHEHSARKHSHLHTKDHCSHCNSISSQSNVIVSKHCCETTAKASAPIAVFAQSNRPDLLPLAQSIDFDRTNCSLNVSSVRPAVLHYKPPLTAKQHTSIIQYIQIASKHTSSEDSDSDC